MVVVRLGYYIYTSLLVPIKARYKHGFRDFALFFQNGSLHYYGTFDTSVFIKLFNWVHIKDVVSYCQSIFYSCFNYCIWILNDYLNNHSASHELENVKVTRIRVWRTYSHYYTKSFNDVWKTLWKGFYDFFSTVIYFVVYIRVMVSIHFQWRL